MKNLSNSKYSVSLRILHWLMAIIIILLAIVALIMTRMSDTDPFKFELYDLHKSFGLVIFGLLFVRFASRWMSNIPDKPAGIAKIAAITSSVTIFLFYIAFALMPLSGFFASQAGGHTVKFFSIELPQLLAKNEELSKFLDNMHIVMGYTLLGLVTLHIFGTIYHLVIDKVNLFKRII